MTMLRSQLGRARGLGSAKDGTHHWWAQRMTSLALVPLSLWFVARLVQHTGAAREDIVGWLSHPVDAALMLLMIAAVFHHAHLGIQVVIEDYVAPEAAKLASIIVVRAVCAFLGVVCAVSVLKIAFGG
jgi:succinate dehydrogenase / fumarate reductase membrane anchor subunit